MSEILIKKAFLLNMYVQPKSKFRSQFLAKTLQSILVLLEGVCLLTWTFSSYIARCFFMFIFELGIMRYYVYVDLHNSKQNILNLLLLASTFRCNTNGTNYWYILNYCFEKPSIHKNFKTKCIIYCSCQWIIRHKIVESSGADIS